MPEFVRTLEIDIENCVVNAPHRYVKEPGLTLVARQPIVDQLRPDLLGVDAKGRLVIIEIKATQATAAAVSQGDEYRRVLDAKSILDIVRLIESYSGRHGVEQIADFASWYKARFGRRKLDSLRPFRVRIVSLGVDSTARRRLKQLRMTGIDIRHADIGGIELVSPVENKRLRRPRLNTRGSRDQQLSENHAYYECGDLFQRVYSDIDRCMSRANARKYPVGIWWGPPAPPVIGVDVFREGIGAVGVLVFKRSVSAAVRRDIDRLCKHLVWVGDTYTTDKTIDTVLVVHSAREWRSHRDSVLRIAREIDARIGGGV